MSINDGGPAFPHDGQQNYTGGMNPINDGGPALAKCARCDSIAVRHQGHQWLCAMHYRFGQMRATAKKDGKAVPTHDDLAAMVRKTCPDCGVFMHWTAHGHRAAVATLQHYRDGTLAIVCRSCNTRHASMPGDSYRDMPKDHKRCPSCRQVKHESEFTADNGRSGPLKRKSLCRTCSNAVVTQWKEANRERYNEYQRQYRAKRKAEGNPVRGGA